MPDKILTISVAAYNAARDIGRCLDSFLIPEVMDQIEVIVVNDGSRDNTKEIAEQYSSKYPGTFKVIDKENGGHGSTINAALGAATGKFFKVVDSDDTVEREGFLHLLEQLEKTSADLIFTPYHHVFDNGGRIEDASYLLTEEGVEFGKEVPLAAVCDKIQVPMHALAYRTKMLQDSPYRMDEKCFYVDVEYTIYYLIYVKNVLLLDKPVYNYYIGDEGQSINIDNMRARRAQHLRVCRSILDFYENEKDGMSFEMRTFISNNIVDMALNHEYRLLVSLVDGKESLKELREFDGYLRNKSRFLYDLVTARGRQKHDKKIALVGLMRKTGFAGYRLVHAVLNKKLTREL